MKNERCRAALAAGLAAGLWLMAGADWTRGQTLEQCVREALRANPGVKSMQARVTAAEAAIQQARSGYYPRLSLQGLYTRSDNPTQAFMMELNQRRLNMAQPSFDPNDPDDTSNLRVSLNARLLLFDGGRRALGTDMARLGHSAADEALAAARNELAYTVTAAYYGSLQAQAYVTVQTAYVASLEESRRVASERFEAGSAVKTDVLNLEVQLAQAREDLIRARNGVNLSVAALNTAIGQDLVPDAGLQAPEPGAPPPAPSEPAAEDVESRPELRAARELTLIRQKAFQKAKRDAAPVVNAFGSYDRDTDDGDNPEDSYTVGVMAEWAFFTGFERTHTVALARAEWEAARLDEEKLRNDLRLDARQAYLRTTEARERLQVMEKSVESAEEALRITHERYEKGAADITELLTAQVGQATIRTRNVAAYYDYLGALANVERARGVLAARHAADGGQ